MAPRKRFSVPTEMDAAIGFRLKHIRVQNGFSRRDIAGQIGLTPDQVKRVENGLASLRFGPAWQFCAFTRVNPLWLAFGDIHPRLGFAPTGKKLASVMTDRASDRFQSVMTDWSERYAGRRARFFKTGTETERIFAENRLAKLNFVTTAEVKHYLTDNILAADMSWDSLRKRLQNSTAKKGARANLARAFGVTTAAVSQWLSGNSAPKADTTLRLLQWVIAQEAKENRNAGSGSGTRPPRKTQKRKAGSNAKPKSRRQEC